MARGIRLYINFLLEQVPSQWLKIRCQHSSERAEKKRWWGWRREVTQKVTWTGPCLLWDHGPKSFHRFQTPPPVISEPILLNNEASVYVQSRTFSSATVAVMFQVPASPYIFQGDEREFPSHWIHCVRSDFPCFISICITQSPSFNIERFLLGTPHLSIYCFHFQFILDLNSISLSSALVHFRVFEGAERPPLT